MRLLRDIRLSRRALPAFAVQGYSWGAFAALVPETKAGIGASDGVFGLALLCASAGAVMAMSLAPAVDRRLGQRGLPLAALAMALPLASLGWTPNVASFAVAMFLMGSGAGLLDVIMNARVSEAEARANVSLMGLNHAGFSAAYAVSAALTGLAREAGLGAVPVFTALLVLTVALGPAMRAEPAGSDSESAQSREGDGFLRIAALAGLVTLVAFLAENATEGWSALHIERTLGGGAAEGALGPAVLGLTMAFGRLAGHLMTVRGEEARVIAIAMLLSGAGALIAAVAPAPGLAYAGFAVLGIGVSVIAPLAIGLAGSLAPSGRRTEIVSRVVMIGFFGFFIGPPLMGFVSQGFGLRAAFAAVGLLLVCSLPAALALVQRQRGYFA